MYDMIQHAHMISYHTSKYTSYILSRMTDLQIVSFTQHDSLTNSGSCDFFTLLLLYLMRSKNTALIQYILVDELHLVSVAVIRCSTPDPQRRSEQIDCLVRKKKVPGVFGDPSTATAACDSQAFRRFLIALNIRS